MTFIFSWKYRARKESPEKYEPEMRDSPLAEFIWWGIPIVLVVAMSTITWVKTYELDPYRPIASDRKPITIQVVALQWKWLFIYPEEKIATINFLQFPSSTPVHFEITADAPMNSFWIPHLGGQIYAMPSMKTELHLMADHNGDYTGSSANLSGEGFAGMHFITRTSSEEDYGKWLEEVKKSPKVLNRDEYKQLAGPSENYPVTTYRLESEDLFHEVIMKYMHPPKTEAT